MARSDSDVERPLTEGTGAPARLSRRRFLASAGGLVLGAALAGCGSRQATPSSAEKVQLVYQDWRTDWFPGMVQTALNQFHAAHPDIQVFYTPDPVDLTERMIRDMEAGTAPDVFQGCCAHFPSWAQRGHALDLRPYVERDLDAQTLADWDRAQYAALFTSDGHQYGLPKYHGALALYYNKDVFDAYGVSYPDESWDHDDYAVAMRALTHDLDGNGETDLWGSMIDITWDRIQVHVNAWGGHLVDPEDPTHSLMADDPALGAMEWIRARMWDDRVMPTFLDVQSMPTREAFSSGRLAMVEDGSWALKDILSTARFRIGVAPLPAGPAARATLATTDGFGIYQGTRHPESAWELLKFLISKEYGRAMAKAQFLQPARASLLADWEGFIRAEFPDETADMDLAAFADGHLQGYSVVAETFANMEDARRIAFAAWQRIFTLGQAGVDIMADVSRRIDETQ